MSDSMQIGTATYGRPPRQPRPTTDRQNTTAPATDQKGRSV